MATTAMDYEVDFGLPGGDNFYDVTQMFADAAAGKTPTRRSPCLLIHVGAKRYAFWGTRPSKRLYLTRRHGSL